MTTNANFGPNIYTGNDSASEFAFTFNVSAAAELKVTEIVIASGAETVRVLTTDYTVALESDGTGTITLVAGALASTKKIVIDRNLAFDQQTNYTENDPFPAKTHEKAIDKNTRLAQQLKRNENRAVLQPIDKTSPLILPAAETGKALGWTSGGEITNVALDPGTALAKASQAEAEAGVENTAYMTPLRAKQAIDSQVTPPEIASQAEAEAGSNNTKFMTPLRTRQATPPASAAEVKTGTEAAKYAAPSTMIAHEGVIKGWVTFDGTAGTISAADSYNVTSLTDNGTGDYTVTWDVDFATVNYAYAESATRGASPEALVANQVSKAEGSLRLRFSVPGGAAADANPVNVIAIGDR